MKKLLFVILFVYFNNASAMTINAGESFYWEFDLVYSGDHNISSTPQSVFGIIGNGDFIDTNTDLLVLEAYENTLSDSPFYSCQNCYGAGVLLPVSWQDLQGALSITLLDGSVEIDSLHARVYLDSGEIYSATLDVASVPIPPALWLFSSGLVGLISFARYK